MIGQEDLLKEIDKQITNNTFPRFSILVGTRGSGKKMIADYIAKQLNAIPIRLEDMSIASVRTMIEDSNKVTAKVCYILADADGMSIAARNAMLKVVEEPPNNCYYIMTLENEYNTLETIRSRGVMFHMSPYSHNELMEYFNTYNFDFHPDYLDMCETPGEIKTLATYDVDAFIGYVNKVITNIARVGGANAFKIADEIALKEDADGYDLKLFWKAFVMMCSITEDYDAIEITAKALQQLRIKGVNRQFLIDKWILDIRKAWM